MKTFKRICPNCNKEITYKYKSTFDNANKRNSICLSCACTNRANKERNADLSSLLKDEYESFYWMGFLLADGSFANTRLIVGLSIKDKEHLEKFAKFIKYKKEIHIKNINDNIGFCDLKVQDKFLVKAIKTKFDIQNNKTENPPKTINKWNRKLLLALFAGFIDGDGSIQKKFHRRDARLGIQIHPSWLSILEEFSQIIFGKNYCKINKRGYAYLDIEDFPVLRRLKVELLEMHLPLMSRKWNNIDEKFINKYERGKIIRPLILEDYDSGMKWKDICVKYNVSVAFLSKIFNERKLL